MAKSHTPGNNVYTTLLFAATVVLLAGVGYTWYRVNEVFGSFTPWFGS